MIRQAGRSARKASSSSVRLGSALTGTTLYGALYSTVYKISATRFEQRLKGLGYDFDTLCRALKVLFENKATIEVTR